MHVISVVNTKGGVGKTTVCVGLAEAFGAMHNRRVLVIDLDPQASASFALIGESRFDDMRHSRHHMLAFLDESEIGCGAPDGEACAAPLSRFVENVASGLHPAPRIDLIGATPELQGFERGVIYRMATAGVPCEAMAERVAGCFHERLAAARDAYDVVVFDCPPGISTFTEAALRISDAVVAPVVPEYLPVMGLEVFLRRVIKPLRDAARAPRLIAALFNRVQHRGEEQIYADQVRAWSEPPERLVRVLQTRLPQMPDMAAAARPATPSARMTYASKYRQAAELFVSVADELEMELESRSAA